MGWHEITTEKTTSKKQRQYLHACYKNKQEWDDFVRWLKKEDATALQDMLYRYYVNKIYDFNGPATD